MGFRQLESIFPVAVVVISVCSLSGVTKGASHPQRPDYYLYSNVEPGQSFKFYHTLQFEELERHKRDVVEPDAAPLPSGGLSSAQPSNPSTLIPEITTFPPATGSPRGWTVPVSVEEQLLDKVDIPDREINETVANQAKNEGDNITSDTQKYYRSKFVSYEHSWVDLDELNMTGKVNVQEHKMLSRSYRRAATIKLKFKFPFYGHPVANITIATGGFLYTGEYVHSWLAATQYIAPLMANFDTSQDESAKIRYADNGTALIVEWKNVYLQSKDHAQKAILEGPFTFQAVLCESGDIIFAYKEVPIKITNIAHEEHPVKVGLSDAYIIDKTIFFVRRKTIYEYHRVSMKDEEITNSTAIYLKALPTCNLLTTCSSCLQTLDETGSELGCQWCPKASLCSDGMDRNRQKWLTKNCDNKSNHIVGKDSLKCELPWASNTIDDRKMKNDHSDITFPNDDSEDSANSDEIMKNKLEAKNDQFHPMAMATLSIILTMIIVVCGWFVYAYLFPHTWSGQLLIKYRPSRWHWRRGEPRYTAASIHM